MNKQTVNHTTTNTTTTNKTSTPAFGGKRARGKEEISLLFQTYLK